MSYYARNDAPADDGALAARVLGALARGCEASPEVADEARMSTGVASAVLSRLFAEGVILREPRPTYYVYGDARQACYRYRLKEAR